MMVVISSISLFLSLVVHYSLLSFYTFGLTLSTNILTTNSMLVGISSLVAKYYNNNTIFFIGLVLFSMVGMKFFFSMSIVMSNMINVYLLGIFSVFIYWITGMWYYGYVMFSSLLYSFMSTNYIFLMVLMFIEGFSILFSSLTISNRISINLFAGSLLMFILGVGMSLTSWSFMLVPVLLMTVIIFMYEQFNLFVQTFMYMLLSVEYSW